MKLVFATPEMVPFAKTGGLADVCGALLKEIRVGRWREVFAILPKYRVIEKNVKGLKKIREFSLTINGETEPVSVEVSEILGFPTFFIDSPKYFDREFLYGTAEGDYPDNDKRFILYNQAVLKTLKELNIQPDVIHCHDWQSALIPAYIKRLFFDDPFFKDTKTVLTIHNLGYQGIFPKETLRMAGFSDDEWHHERLEYWGKFSFLKAGIVYADYITTVSKTYANEIQTQEFGLGLDGVLRSRKDRLFGITNGIDTNEWDPRTDKVIFKYSGRTTTKKVLNKLFLQKKNSLIEDKNIFLIGMVTRLCDQKGLDITCEAIDEIIKKDIQLVILGIGEERYHILLEEMAKRYKGKIGVNIKFDEKLARMIYAGADAFLIPSRYEPCGLTQMIALRYGTLPIVRKTGGLADTVRDEENGFVFEGYTKDSLISAIERAKAAFSNKKLWKKMVLKGIQEDFSWQKSAREYYKLYSSFIKFKTKPKKKGLGKKKIEAKV